MFCALSYVYNFVQAMHAQSSVAVGMKGASKAMAAVNKVASSIIFEYHCMAVDIVITYLFDRLQRPRRDLHLNETLQGLGEEPLVVRVREPCPPRLLL